MHKFYLCVVCGHLKEKKAALTGYLEKNKAQNRVYVSQRPKEGAKTIRTRYRVLEERRGFSLVEVELLTRATPAGLGPTSPPSATPWPGTASTAKTP